MTSPFVFSSDVFCLIMTLLLSSLVLFNCFWHVAQFQNNTEARGPVLYFSCFDE